MSEHQRILILLIKSALNGKTYTLPEQTDLTEVFQIATRHGVDEMAYYGAIACGVDKHSDLMKTEFMRVCRSISISETQLAEVHRMLDVFEEQRIDHMPLKGTLLKSLYPHAEMRRMGDADILIKCEQYESIRMIMKDLGYEEKYESDHELVWCKNSVNIELHKRLIPSYNKDYYSYYGDGWRLARLLENHSHRYCMKDEDEMIYLFTHFAKHYRDSGIGIRHIVDLWVYRQHHLNMDEEYIQNELDKLQLLEFYKNILNTLSVWFDDCPEDDKSDFITNFIFTSGQYGRAQNSKLSSLLKNTKSGMTEQEIKRNRVFTAIFPSYGVMSREYQILKKAPILLPIMWIARWWRKIVIEKKTRGFADQRLKFNSGEISDYQQSLNYVGLDFNFVE